MSQLSQVNLFSREGYIRPLVPWQQSARREIGRTGVINCLVLMHQGFVAENAVGLIKYAHYSHM